EKVVGLYVAVPAAAPTAPCAPENVTASFPKGSLTGTVTFDIPARLYGGDAASGPVTYTIDAGDQEAVATGQAAFGQNGVSAQVTLQTTGTTEFSVYLTNDGGDSPRATTQCFVGYGVPMTPANIHASHDGHAMTVTWDAVNASADGGYINPDDITYTVTELPSGNTVAQATRNTSVIIPMEVPEHSTPFRYTVTATHNGITSAPGRSNSVPLGAITPPYRQTFDDEESLAYFTVVDANNDGITWAYFNGEARVLWNDQIPMDDWMISAPLALEAGKAYHITADIRSAYTGFSERLEIKAGTSPDPAAMTITVAQPVDVADENRLTTGGYLVPQTTGLYHIGLHGMSDPDMARLYLDNFTVTEGSSAARPAAPASFDVTADPDGEHIASITATAPATDIAGNQLPVLTKAELS
ncbi:MAG: hypothetical protein K2O10_04280, partial [Muribaculaceae bacterium]|nr:hypothetical protein [Muribaculaceae bacterium]